MKNPLKRIVQAALLTSFVAGLAFTAQLTIDNSPGALTKIQANFSEVYQPIAVDANETAAGATIVNGGYQRGDLRRYGLVCLNSTADTATGSTHATSNTTILNALGAAAWTDNITFRWPSGICRINDAVVISSTRISHHFDNRNQIHYYGTADKIALTIGNSTPSDHGGREVLGGAGLMLINKTSNPYTNDAFVGLQLLGTFQNCRFTFRRVEGFTIGLQSRPSTLGFVYNAINLGEFVDNKYHVDLHSFGSGEFINENLFLGGSFRTSAMANTLDSYGVRFTHESGGYTGHNRNIFIKPSFELGDAQSGANRTPVLYNNNGNYNEFRNVRVETGRGYIVDVVSTTTAVTRNFFEGSIQSGVWTAYQRESDGGLAYGNSLINSNNGRETQQPYWSSGDIPKKALGTDTAKVSVKGFFFQNTASSTATYSGTARLLRNYLRLPGSSTDAIGVEIDTSYFKSLLVRLSVETGFGGRMRFVCYDSAGAVLTSAGAGHPYVVGGTALTYSAAYGGGYATGTDGVTSMYFSVGSACVKTRLLLLGGSQAMHLRSFELYALTNGSNPKPLVVTDTGLPQQADAWYVNGSPATVISGGLVAKGQIFYNSAAASGQPGAYVATAQGYLAKNWVATTTFVVGELANNDTGKTYEQVTSPTCTSAGSGGPTGTGSAITDNTCSWNYIGTQATIAAMANLP